MSWRGLLASIARMWHKNAAKGYLMPQPFPAISKTRIATVLLDRDGTVILDKHYLSDPGGVELFSATAHGLKRLVDAGMRLFVVTNQSGIGRGYFSEADYRACHAAMEELLREEGVAFSGAAFCPHDPDRDCACRKPAPGMWQDLAQRHGLEAARTAMVGDKAEDVLFGRNANFSAVVLVLTGKGEDTARKLGLLALEAGEPFRVIESASLPGGENLPHALARDLDGTASFLLGLPPPA